jgi:8-oxo-dGTP pyrophosphatase MutT (NUDIX family)
MQDAALTIVTKSEKGNLSVLLVRRTDVPVWVLPGGGIEHEELPEFAAIRETHEETGLTVEIIHHVATYQPINRLAAPIYLFSCRPLGSSTPILTKENREVDAAEFFPVHNLPLTLFPFHKTFIQEWFEAKTVPIIRPLTEITYFSVLKLALLHPIFVARYICALVSRNL